jgi:hypothetical protein
VEADVQPIDKNGDGSPEGYRRFGAVGFLRPAYLVSAMIGELENRKGSSINDSSPTLDPSPQNPSPQNPAPQTPAQQSSAPQWPRQQTPAPKPPAPKAVTPGEIIVRGVVRSQSNSKPIAGALVGIVPLGTVKVTEENLLAWGNTNSNGQFKLNNSIQPGKYTLRATAIGHIPYAREIEITRAASQFAIEMRSSSNQ